MFEETSPDICLEKLLEKYILVVKKLGLKNSEEQTADFSNYIKSRFYRVSVAKSINSTVSIEINSEKVKRYSLGDLVIVEEELVMLKQGGDLPSLFMDKKKLRAYGPDSKRYLEGSKKK